MSFFKNQYAWEEAALSYLLREDSVSLVRTVRSVSVFNYFILCLPSKLSPKVLYIVQEELEKLINGDRI